MLCYILNLNLLFNSSIKALNDDLPSTLTVHQVAETRSSHDCPVELTLIWRPENIIFDMAYGSLIGKSIFDLFSVT